MAHEGEVAYVTGMGNSYLQSLLPQVLLNADNLLGGANGLGRAMAGLFVELG